MPPEQHALLSASSAERWLHCTRAPRLEETLPDTGSTYAREGSVAHALAELKARKKFTEPMTPRAFSHRHEKIAADPGYTGEMEEYTDQYIDALAEEAMCYEGPPVIALEVRVDYSDFAPEGFGTADCVMIGGDCLTVCDFKYGRGVSVSAVENAQMRLYALGALKLYGGFYGEQIQRIRLRIIQPRAGGGDSWELSRQELEQWGRETVAPQAAAAYAGTGDFNPGPWCRFCRAKAQCRSRSAEYLALEAFGGLSPAGAQTSDCGADEPLLSDAEVGDVLHRAEDLAAWVKDLQEYALAACLEGREIPGYKAVEGRSVRSWKDQDKALEILQENGFPREVLCDVVPKSLSQLEKLVGKKPFANLVGELIDRPAGKPALAPVSDKRPAYNRAAAAFGGEAGA